MIILAAVTLLAFGHPADPTKPLLARFPTLSATTIVFEFGTDLWKMPRDGGRARRLTSGPGIEAQPHFSPDGQMVAFVGDYDGNDDVYVVPVDGGSPRRLTYHPGPDIPVGWASDGRSILFTSSKDDLQGRPRLYTVPLEGGWPSALPLPRGSAGSFSPDGTSIAYVPLSPWQPGWHRYRGGQTTPIWIARLSDSKVQAIPRQNSNDRSPMWIGDKVYFLSDRDDRYSLYSYDTRSKKVSQLLKPETLDIKSAEAGPDGIVFERLGSLHLYDLKTGSAKKLTIELEDDLVELRPSREDVSGQIAGGDLSPSGARAVFEAHGDIFTVPAGKGDARNITQTAGIAERNPAWSPDGSKVAYLSDASGNYMLHVVSQTGGTPEVYTLSDKPTWYLSLSWSPDSKKMLCRDQDRNVRMLDFATRKVTFIDKSPTLLMENMSPSWSPDSKWIVYSRTLANHLNAVFLYSVETGKSTQVTDGLSDAISPVFDSGGQYLYFLASTDVGMTLSFADMSSMGARLTRSPYLVVLKADDPSPFAPESDEERSGEPGAPKPAGPSPMRIDLDGIGQRILAIPMPAASYGAAVPAMPGSVLILQNGAPGQPGTSILQFDIASRRPTPFAQGVFGIAVNAKGDKALLQTMGGWAIVPTAAPPAPGQGALRTTGFDMVVDPRAEWRQMFTEAWRNQRDFSYDPNTHGIDIEKAKAYYEPYLENLSSNADFDHLLNDMLNEVTVSHMFTFGGQTPSSRPVAGGLLGADYKIENGRYRFARVFNGENWNPNLRAPLTQPGVNVKAGEYLLAVDGRELTSASNVYEAFENTAGKQVSIKVGPNPDGSGSRVVTVVPVGNEVALRYRAWIEDNRRKVESMSGGRISYVYIPNTGQPGYDSFNRYFVAQLGRDAVLMDDRDNQGGALSDYIVQVLDRKILGFGAQRAGDDFQVPAVAVDGPKAMLINEMAGSGGDALPWFFKVAQVGPLIGKRTWGGLVGVSGGVPLINGGWAGSPQSGIYGLNGKWEVENHGVDPDIEVEEDPFLWRQGKDPQLERGVAYLMEQLKKSPPRKYVRPAYPVYKRGPIDKGG
jgi:tricorn protease